MTSDDKSGIDYYKVKRDLATLKSKHGYHTELISLYVPPSRPIDKVIGYLRNEISESSNIKSKSTRQMVTDAITSLIARLKVLSDNKVQSSNGFILFDGFIPRHGPARKRKKNISSSRQSRSRLSCITVPRNFSPSNWKE